jgi:hypothetical protein
MRAIRLQYAAGHLLGANDMAKKRKTAAKRAKKPAKRASKRSSTGTDMDTTVNALVILVVIALVIGGIYMYMQKAKAEPALIDVTPISLIAPK